MAKQLTRVEKRYVPQQESYRNLPGLRPTAEPVVAAETPVVSGEGEKLRQMAEALASGNKALKDFFSMEKSFEETNRVENRVRAQMGLPPIEGQGLLDYGVAQGYNEGLGILKGQEAMLELRRRLQESNYGISQEAIGTPDDVRQRVDAETTRIMSEFLPPDANQAYMEGAAKFITQAKLEARVEGIALWQAEEKKQRFNNYSSFVNNHFNTEMAPRMEEALRMGTTPDTLRLRGEITDLTRIGRDKFGFDRDTAVVVVLDNLKDQLRMQQTQALSQEDSFDRLTDLEDMADALLLAVDAPDADGIRLSSLKTPEVQKAIEDLRVTTERFNGMAEGVRQKNQAKVRDDKLGQYAQRLAKDGDFESVHAEIKSSMASGDIDGTIGMGLLVDLGRVWDAGVFSRVPLDVMDNLRRQAVTGQLTHEELLESSINNRMTKEAYNELSGLISDYRNDDSYRYTLSQRAKAAISGDTANLGKVRREAKQRNSDAFNRISNELGLSGSEKDYIEETFSQEFTNVYEDIPADIMKSSIARYRGVYRKFLTEERAGEARIESGVFTPEEQQELKAENTAAINLKRYKVGSSKYNEAQAELYRIMQKRKIANEQLKNRSEGRSWQTSPISPPSPVMSR